MGRLQGLPSSARTSKVHLPLASGRRPRVVVASRTGKRNATKTARVSAPTVLSRDGLTPALQAIHRKLTIAASVANVCAATLRAQATDHDTDVALCLQRCVGAEIDRQLEAIERLLEWNVSGRGSSSTALEEGAKTRPLDP